MADFIRKFKDDANNIEIPEKELQMVINQAINGSKQKKIIYSPFLKAGSIAIALIFFILGSGFVSPVMANLLSNIPYINSVLPYSDIGLKAVFDKGYVKTVGETVIDEGIPLTITDVYYDDSRLEIGYIIPLENVKLGNLRDIKILGIENANIFVNGKDVGYQSSGNYSKEKISGTMSILLNPNDLPDEVEIKLQVTELLNKHGQWLFQVPVEKVSERDMVEIGKRVKNNQNEFVIENILYTPSATKLNYQFKTGTDNFQPHSLTFFLLNEKGEQLQLIRSGEIKYQESDKSVSFSRDLFFEPTTPKSGKLKIIPVLKGVGEEDVMLKELTIEIN